jgi:hypothetical protein
VLRQLVPLLGGYDLVVLAHDTGLRSDYRTIEYVLRALGAAVARFEVSRVPIGGATCSTRFGGWQGHTLAAFAGQMAEEFGLEAFRLGLRLYLVAGLGGATRQSFSTQHLKRWARRARKLLAEQCGRGQDADERVPVAWYLHRLASRHGYPDPYRIATALMARDDTVPTAGLLRTLMH